MRGFIKTALFVACIWLLQPILAYGQLPASTVRSQAGIQRYLYERPTVSPYLNLLRNQTGATAGLPAYQTLVRPLLEARATAVYQNQEIGQIQRQVQNVVNNRPRVNAQGIPVTGHPTRFLNYSHFYPGFGNQ